MEPAPPPRSAPPTATSVSLPLTGVDVDVDESDVASFKCIQLGSLLAGCLVGAVIFALTALGHTPYTWSTAHLLDSASGSTYTSTLVPASACVCYCQYGASSYPGFWLIDRLLYLHLRLASACQLRPLAWQLGVLSSTPLGQRTDAPWNDSLLVNASVTVPDGWPSNFSVPRWLNEHSGAQQQHELVQRLRNAVIVLIGDSVDRFLFRAVCGQMGARVQNFPELFGWNYSPMACRAPLNNFTVVHIHHYGVLHAWWPSTHSWVVGQNFSTTLERVQLHLPAVLSRLALRPSDVSLVQLSSGLWDLSNKNSSFRFSSHVLHRHWLPLMRSQLLDPLLSLWGPAPTRLPLILLRTTPPTRWGEPAQELIVLLNDALRLLVLEYAALGSPVELLDMATVLAERQSWCVDTHHYSEVTQLQLVNVMLHMLDEHSRRQTGAKACPAQQCRLS